MKRITAFLAPAFLLASLSIVGLPPTGGTWSKFYLMLGALESGALLLAAALVMLPVWHAA